MLVASATEKPSVIMNSAFDRFYGRWVGEGGNVGETGAGKLSRCSAGNMRQARARLAIEGASSKPRAWRARGVKAVRDGPV